MACECFLKVLHALIPDKKTMRLTATIVAVIAILSNIELASGYVKGAFGYSNSKTCSKPASMSVYDAGLTEDTLQSSVMGNYNCHWRTTDAVDGSTVLWGAGQVFRTGGAEDTGEFSYILANLYVPRTGNYRMRAHFCPSGSRNTCTISRSAQTMDSINALKLSSDIAIYTGQHDFGGYSGTLAVDSNACYALVDSAGKEWSGGGGFMCSDANPLSNTPSTCYLNNNMDLDVDMGTLERSEITSAPASGASGNVKKTFPVLCTRDSAVTVSTTFQFTPLTFNGNEVVSTTAPNLGVAIFYNGKLVGPTSTAITETFKTGSTDRELEFQVLRNPDAELKDIPTGAFNASAVMVMTAQ